jgi:hypothetical protein
LRETRELSILEPDFKQEEYMKVLYEDVQNPEKTTIRIEGLEREVKLMHITDSHFAEYDERDPEAREVT